MANARARRNFLSKIKVNGVNLSSLEDIKEGVCRAYQSLISNSGDWRPSINGLNFKELGEDLASSLEVMFSEEEIFAALSSCCGDKAPGPDDSQWPSGCFVGTLLNQRFWVCSGSFTSMGPSKEA